MDKETKETILKEYRIHEKDTGSADAQVALLTKRIGALTEHLGVHRQDHSTRRGLLKLVGRRKRLLSYLSRSKPVRYQSLISRLGLRK